jgi:hypothetical protein
MASPTREQRICLIALQGGFLSFELTSHSSFVPRAPCAATCPGLIMPSVTEARGSDMNASAQVRETRARRPRQVPRLALALIVAMVGLAACGDDGAGTTPGVDSESPAAAGEAGEEILIKAHVVFNFPPEGAITSSGEVLEGSTIGDSPPAARSRIKTLRIHRSGSWTEPSRAPTAP